MARTWLSVTVELLGGRGEELWPWPGRIFAVGPSHTFGDLADAINDAFARWDRSHLSMFTLSDGRVVTDKESGVELTESIGGPILVPLDLESATVVRTVKLGAEFQFVFDLGDGWTHRCVVGMEKIDPIQVLGVRPATPLPYWGWGDIPDQYGRRWSGDDGTRPVPQRPRQPHPMLLHTWPGRDQLPSIDLSEVRVAERQHDHALRARMERAIQGRGAFRRFRDLVHEEGLAEQWYAFSSDRQQGRARDFLAEEGIRVGSSPWPSQSAALGADRA